MKSNNKTITIILIIILSILAIGTTGLLIVLLNNPNIKPFNFNISSNESENLVLDETYDKLFNIVDITSEAGNVYIKESTSDNVRVVIYGEEKNTKVNVNDDKLIINIKTEKCIGFCFDSTISKVEVYLPKNYDKKIKVINNYGNIKVGDFKNATLDIEDNSGDIFITNGDEIKVVNDYGDVEIDEANKIDINVSAGDIKINKVNDIIATNSYGNIAVETINNYLKLTNECGDIKLTNITLNKNSSIKDEYGDVEITNTNEIFINAKTELGDVDIKKNYNKSDITLKIENECGDIIVDN